MDALEKRLKRRKRIFDKFFKSVNHHFFVTDKNYLKLMKLNRELDGLVQRGGVGEEGGTLFAITKNNRLVTCHTFSSLNSYYFPSTLYRY